MTGIPTEENITEVVYCDCWDHTVKGDIPDVPNPQCPKCNGTGILGVNFEWEEHIDDNKYEVAMRNAFNTHLLNRKNPQLTVTILALHVGMVMANEVSRGAQPSAIREVIERNTQAGYESHLEVLRQQAEAEKLAPKSDKKH